MLVLTFLVYSSVSVNTYICIGSRNRHHDQNIELFPHPSRLFLPFLNPWQLLTCCPTLQFFLLRMSCKWNRTVCNLSHCRLHSPLRLIQVSGHVSQYFYFSLLLSSLPLLVYLFTIWGTTGLFPVFDTYQ